MPTRPNDERQDRLLALAARATVVVPEPTVKPQRSPLLILAVAGVVAVGVAVAWPRGGEVSTASPTAPVATVVPTAAPTVPVPTATPDWPDIAPYVALVEAHINGGRYREAMTTAEGALSLPRLREADRRALIGYVVTAGLKDIETQEFAPLDQAQHRHLVDVYLSLRERAKGASVAIDTPLQVARRAFASSQFPLARVALEEAIADGSFNPQTDRDVTRLYVSTLYGIGAWYTTAEKDSPLYEEGLRWLVTSDVLADKYKTGQSEAEARLNDLGLTDRAQWPPRKETPL